MAQAIVIHQPGGPGVLRPQTITVGKPGPNELRIRQTAIGVNFHDVYVRSGLYQTLALPGIPGIEAVGIVEEIGSQVNHFTVGDRIGYITRSYGVYTSERLLPADLAIRLPDSISDDLAATLLLKGLTAEMLVKQVLDITNGKGVNVAYDSVGKDTFHGSLDSLAICGHLVNFGPSRPNRAWPLHWQMPPRHMKCWNQGKERGLCC